MAQPAWEVLQADAGTPVHALSQLVLERSAACLELVRFASDAGVPLTHAIVAACGRTLVAHPEANVLFEERDGVPGWVYRGRVDVGLAVATDAGLVIATVRGADRPLPAVFACVDRLLDAAREGRLGEGDVGGGAITVLHPGVLGVGVLTEVARPPESCLLVVRGPEGDPTELSLTFAVHRRPLDGSAAERLLATLARLLEHPYRCLV